MEVQQSTNYGMFKFIRDNRVINEQKVKGIMKSEMEGCNYLRFNPIFVDPTYMIIDGQHRYEASKRLKEPIYYLQADKAIHIKHIAKLNQNMSNWKVIDYVKCYNNLGNNNYFVLTDYFLRTSINIGTLASMLSQGKVSQ